MQFFPNDKSFLAIGGFTIQWYAILILIGIGVSYWFVKRDFKENGYVDDTLDDLLMGCLLCGIIGARLWYCLFSDPAYFFSDISHLLNIRGGGLAIQGGLMGGSLFGLYYTRKRHISFFRIADMVFGNMLISQAIGRWGNFVNQEAFGQIVSESYYQYFPSFIKDRMYIDGAYRQPTFLWESVLDLLGFILIRLYRKYGNPKRGDQTFLYLIWYGTSRFIIEYFRTDNLMIGSFRMSRIIALIFVIFGISGFVLTRVIKSKEKPVILFDLDGTLLNTEPAIIASYKYLFEKYDKVENFDEAKQVEVLGPPLTVMFEKYFPNVDKEVLLKDYREHNWNIHKDVVTPMKNAKELLAYLKDEGYKLGIVSTKIKDVCVYGLSIFDMDKYFDVVIGQDEVTKGKPDPEGIFKACKQLNMGHDNCIYVGDSKTDILAAKNAGVYAIGYLFDKRREEALLSAKPNEVIDDLIKIEDILKENKTWTYNMM